MDGSRHSIPVRTVYRIVWTNPPLVDDLKPIPVTNAFVRSEYRELATGISVFRTFAQARRTAAGRPPWLGRGHIAEILLPESGTYRLERTTASRGHYTLWADPRDILEWVGVVLPVTPSHGGDAE